MSDDTEGDGKRLYFTTTWRDESGNLIACRSDGRVYWYVGPKRGWKRCAEMDCPQDTAAVLGVDY